MTRRTGVIATFLLFAAAPIALAQFGGEGVHLKGAGFEHGARNSETADTQQALLIIKATDMQREALAYCMTATDAAHKLTGRLDEDASYWHGRHGGYDIGAVSEKKDQLQSALTEMATAHQQFLQSLSQDQDTELEPNLGRLEHLQRDLKFEMSQLDEELIAARPDSFDIYLNVHRLGKTIGKWGSEHKRIAKKMSISKPQAGKG